MKCVDCHRRATMISPRDWCDLHWQLWMCGTDYDYPKGTLKRHVRFIRQCLRESWRRYGRPRDWRGQWRAAYQAVLEREDD